MSIGKMVIVTKLGINFEPVVRGARNLEREETTFFCVLILIRNLALLWAKY